MKREDIDERWLPVVGWEGLYEVSDAGRVRSLERTGMTRYGLRRYGGALMRPFVGTVGYLVVGLSRRDRRCQALVHGLVLAAFVGPRPIGMNACHNDGNPLNATLSNLRWDTQSGNINDCNAHGTMQRGERHVLSKLTEDSVRKIRAGMPTAEAAMVFGVSKSTVNNARIGKTWSHL